MKCIACGADNAEPRSVGRVFVVELHLCLRCHEWVKARGVEPQEPPPAPDWDRLVAEMRSDCE